MDWSKTLIRCSSLGCLFTEPQSKADKDAGNLSKTAKTHLKSVYIQEKYGRRKEIVTKAMRRGIEDEPDSIVMLSRFHKKILTKNDERLTNDFLTGHPDIIIGADIKNADHVTDVKTCEDIWTFHDKVGESIDNGYYAQLQGYLFLTNGKSADISYCLPNYNESMIMDEKMYLVRRMNVISEESPEFVREFARVEKNMVYDDIPLSEKLIIQKVARDDDFIAKIPEKVKKAREYLAEYDKICMALNN
jgi:hypothetical protein